MRRCFALLALCCAAATAAAEDEAAQAALDLRLFRAAQREAFGEVDSALEEGADIDGLVPVGPPEDPGASKVTALMQAALDGRVAAVEYLLEQGADADQPDAFGFTPMHGCAFRGQAAACSALLAAVGPTSETALHYHADGFAPLHRTCFGNTGSPATLRVFLEAGVAPDLPSIEDRAGRGGRPGTTCRDVASADEVTALLDEFAPPASSNTDGSAKRRAKGGGRMGKSKGTKKAELSVDDILASHPDL